MKLKTILKNLKRGDVVSIDWINAGDLDDCQFYGALFVGYALKRYGHFTDQTRREAILKFDTEYTNSTQAQNAVC